MTSLMSELAGKHPMTIKDELLRRAVKLLTQRGVDRETSPSSSFTWREFKTDSINIADASDGIFTIGVGQPNNWAPVWVDAIRCRDNLGLVLNYDHERSVRALEEMRRLMVLDDLADI